MPMVNANGVELYFEEHGEGAAILCIHGTSGSALTWHEAAKELAKRGKVIVYDRRGSFRSERPKPYETTDVSEHTDDAAALLDALSATPAVVMGRSYGGEIALDLAYRFPEKVKALALLEPAALGLDPDTRAWGEAWAQKIVEAGEKDPTSVAEVLLRDAVGDDMWESFPEELKDMFVGNGPAILAELRGRWLDLTDDELAEIGHPALLVSAEDSLEVFRRADEHLAEALPNVERVFVGGGHLIDPTHPAVLDFVDRMVTAPTT